MWGMFAATQTYKARLADPVTSSAAAS